MTLWGELIIVEGIVIVFRRRDFTYNFGGNSLFELNIRVGDSESIILG